MTRVVMAVVITVGMALFTASAFSQANKPITIKSGKVHEKCLSLTPPQKLAYSFESAAKVNFNLNYRKGDLVYYPVKLDRTNGEAGLYEAKARENYCLVWENKSGADIALTYSAKIAQ